MYRAMSSLSFPRSDDIAGEAVEVVWWLSLVVVAVVAAKLWLMVPGLLPRLDGVGSVAVDEASGWLYRSSSKAPLDPATGWRIWWQRTSSGLGKLHRPVLLLIRLRDGCGLLDPFGDFPSAPNNVKPALGVRQRRRAVDTVWRWKTKCTSRTSL
jgi:hypothetical protein